MRKGIFIKDVTLNDGMTISRGTVCEVEEIYAFVMIDGEERVLPESLIEPDGTLKMPYITCDDKVYEAGDKLEVTEYVAAVKCPDFYCGVDADSIMVECETDEMQ